MDSKNQEPNNSIKEAKKGVIPSNDDKFVQTKDGKVFFGSAQLFNHYQLVVGGRDDPSLREQILSQRFPNAGLITELPEREDRTRVFVVFGSSGDLVADDGSRFDSMPDLEKLKRDRVTADLLNFIYEGEIVFLTREDIKK